MSAAVLELVPDDTRAALCPECDGYGFGGPCERCGGEGLLEANGLFERECPDCEGSGVVARCEECFATGMAEAAVRAQSMVWTSAPASVRRLVLRLNDRLYAGFPAIDADGAIRVRGVFGAKAWRALAAKKFKSTHDGREWVLQLPLPKLSKDDVTALRKRARALRKRVGV